MSGFRWPWIAGAVAAALLLSPVPSGAQRCDVDLPNSTNVSCTPLSAAGWPVDSTGGRWAFGARETGAASERGNVAARTAARASVGVLLRHAGDELPAMAFLAVRTHGSVRSLALQPDGDSTGALGHGASVVLAPGGGHGPVHLRVQGLARGEVAHAELVTGGKVVAAAKGRAALAQLPSWPSGFGLRAVPGGTEITWLLPGPAPVTLGGGKPVKGEQLRVTLPARAGVSVMPVLLRADGCDRVEMRAGEAPLEAMGAGR